MVKKAKYLNKFEIFYNIIISNLYMKYIVYL